MLYVCSVYYMPMNLFFFISNYSIINQNDMLRRRKYRNRKVRKNAAHAHNGNTFKYN